MRFSSPFRGEHVVKKIKRRFLFLIPHTAYVHDWRVLESFRFYYDDKYPKHYVLVDKGWESDLASVPGFFGFVLQKDGIYTQAAVTHDWCYKNRGDVVWVEDEDGTSTKAAPLTREEQDKVFLNAMKVCNTNLPTRVIMWRAVRRFGWISYPKNK